MLARRIDLVRRARVSYSFARVFCVQRPPWCPEQRIDRERTPRTYARARQKTVAVTLAAALTQFVHRDETSFGIHTLQDR